MIFYINNNLFVKKNYINLFDKLRKWNTFKKDSTDIFYTVGFRGQYKK